MVTLADAQRVMPHRYRRAAVIARDIRGSTELAYLPLLAGRELEEFDRLWLIEEDVDFSGPWSDFMEQAMTSPADLVGMHFTTRPADPDWPHWAGVVHPAGFARARLLRGFLPVMGLSRAAITAAIAMFESPDWAGHTEFIFTTAAAASGLSIATLSDSDAAYPLPEIRDAQGDCFVTEESFHCDSNIASAYFHEKPSGFPRPNTLYHPVKVDMPAEEVRWRFNATKLIRRTLPVDPLPPSDPIHGLAAMALGLRADLRAWEDSPLSRDEAALCAAALGPGV